MQTLAENLNFCHFFSLSRAFEAHSFLFVTFFHLQQALMGLWTHFRWSEASILVRLSPGNTSKQELPQKFPLKRRQEARGLQN